MAISVVTDYTDLRQNTEGFIFSHAVLSVTGLAAGAANTIPHALIRTPYGLPNYQATSGTPGFETSVPDATNLYYTAGAGQTSLRVSVEY
ncbi:MAG: hypothetical protein ACRD19_17335 [Terriglobia bacterium]